ncbi:hypothetical protein [uncultured Robinsoniella sp.]|uniref:hypothetical protein n=1 Tax=uncultured Robinsoniella sp. TaxID=904190 RepID=UPI00374F0C4C
MAGLYTEGESKILSGVYSLILAISTAITSGSRGVVAYPFTADWGPVNKLVSGNAGILKESFNAVGSDLSVKKVYTHATKGEPKRVLGYRMADSTAKPAEVVLGDWTLETLYPSTRKFMVVVKEGVEDGTIKLSLVENSVELLVINAATVDALESGINVSDYIRVKKKGAALPEATAGVAFANGSNGDNVTIQQYSAFLDAIEADGTANAFSLDGVEDEAIIASVVAWLSTVRQEGFYVTYVNGGPAVWDTALDNANAKSREFNSRPIINVGNGCDGYTSAEMAIFIAARVAAVALNSTLTDETVPYNTVNHRLKRSVREKARQSGTLIFVANGDTVEIDEAVNTLTSPKAGEVAEMGSIRVSSTIDYVVHDLEVFGEEYKKAKSNTEEFRATYATTVEQNYLQPLVRQEILKDGVNYKPDPEYHGENSIYKPKANEAFFTGDITPNESPERIYQKLLTVF